MTAVWAHRGASGYAPENTLAAFALAIEQGADGVELDVHLSADGEVVVCHDATVERTTSGTGRIADLTLAELQAFDAGGGERIPLLAEVFELLRPSGLLVNVELKTDQEGDEGIEQAVLDVIVAAGFDERTILSSFNHHSLKQAQKLAPEMPVGLLYVENLWEPGEYGSRFGAQALHPYFPTLAMPGVVADAHARGLRVHPWTVNDQVAMAWQCELGVDAIITNFPDIALRVVA